MMITSTALAGVITFLEYKEHQLIALLLMTDFAVCEEKFYLYIKDIIVDSVANSKEEFELYKMLLFTV